MAVFMVNICKFNSCGLTFPNLADLIQHIEDTHIDYDPRTVEQKEQQQPSCLPLSYVLRFFTDAARKEGLETKRKIIATKTTVFGTRSNTPTGSDADEEEVMSESEDSNDSWTTPEEFSAEFILRYGSSRVLNQSNVNGTMDKPFACPVPGCKKRYKNVNGIKYHSKNGHKKDGKIRKGFKCHCGKSYKTGQGLKNHTTAHHNGVNLATLTTQTGEVIQIPTSHVASLQPLRAVTLKQISAASLNALGLPIKSIQSIVVASKQSESISKSDGIYDTITLSKGQTLQMAVPSMFTSTKGLLSNIVTSKPHPEQTVTSAFGVLTPATSPQNLPPDVASVKTPTPVSVSSSLPIASPMISLNTPVKTLEINPPTVLKTVLSTNHMSVGGDIVTIVTPTTRTARPTI